ncbi:hypothetical protein REPUB_Repub05bG0110300 [Reevesia pubescens]
MVLSIKLTDFLFKLKCTHLMLIWKRITDIAPKCGLFLGVPRLYDNSFVNGAIHLIAHERKSDGKIRSLLLAFDVCEEVFNEIPLPRVWAMIG